MSKLTRLKPGMRPFVLRDFPEHFNWSMGRRVKSRKDHRRIQREMGVQDWEPCRNSPGSQLTLERLR